MVLLAAAIAAAALAPSWSWSAPRRRVGRGACAPRRLRCAAASEAAGEEPPVYSAVCDGEGSTRLDAFLAGEFPERSRREWAEAIAAGAVRVNGDPAVRKSHGVRNGDAVDATAFASETAGDILAEDLPLDVLFEDDEVLVVNKAAGMVTHPAPGVSSGTLANAVAFRCQGLAGLEAETGGDAMRPGIVHRLDRYTSGAIVVAKTPRARADLQRQFKDRTVDKLYLAVLARPPPPHAKDDGELVVDAPIARHPTKRDRMAVVNDGRHARSRFRVLAFDDESRCLAQVAIDTGRTHQIRVHLAHVGSPVLGDPVYGDDYANKRAALPPMSANRTLLHAWRLAFDHPASGQRVDITAPPPPDLARATALLAGRA